MSEAPKRPTLPPRVLRSLVWIAVVLPFTLVAGASVFLAVVTPGCARCHNDAAFVEATDRSAHSGVECVACHVPAGALDRAAFGFRQAFHMGIPIISSAGRDWEAVPDSRCMRCHEEVVDRVVAARGLRIDHATCAKGSACTDCHSTTAHTTATAWPRVYDMETCLRCHVASDVSANCDLCHDGKLPADRVTTGVFAITHGPRWEQTHGMGGSATCTACHTAANCAKCHGVGLPHEPRYLKVHAAHALSKEARCLSCHEATFCSECHGTAMPHTNAFTRTHAAAARADEKLCTRCHAEADCITCHVTHVHPGGAIGALTGKGGER